MGVDIFDKDKIWKAASGLCGVVLGHQTHNGGPTPTDVEISTLIQQREKARGTNDYVIGDMIRDELKEWGVDIFDKDKVWRCKDGRSGQVPNFAAVTGVAAAPTAMVVQPVQQRQSAHSHTNQLNQLIAACVANAQNPATSARTMALLQQAAMVSTPA